MKSRDSYELFEVFKPGYMDGATFFQKFCYWFKSVYWYHFKYHTLGAILLIVALITLIGDVAGREYNDLDYILGGAVYAETEQMDELSAYLGSFIKEDGTARVGGQMLCTTSAMGTGTPALAFDEYAAASIQKIQISFADDEVLLFILDKEYADWYRKEGAFEPLSTFGIESDDGYLVRIDDAKIIKKLGIESDGGVYIGIKVKTEQREKKERIAKKYENAALALSGLISDK